MQEDNYKEVYFDVYCRQCRHEDKAETEDPCHDCMTQGKNVDSHKPVYFDQKG